MIIAIHIPLNFWQNAEMNLICIKIDNNHYYVPYPTKISRYQKLWMGSHNEFYYTNISIMIIIKEFGMVEKL